jgi:hypothetical protein
LVPPLNCVYKGVLAKTKSNTNESTHTGLQMSLQGFDPATGAVTWNLPVRDIDDLTNGNAEFVDDNSLLVQLADGTRAILDTSSGTTGAVPPGQIFWCIGGHTFKVNEDKTFNKAENRPEGNEYYSCNENGESAQAWPSSSPNQIGVTVDGEFMWRPRTGSPGARSGPPKEWPEAESARARPASLPDPLGEPNGSSPGIDAPVHGHRGRPCLTPHGQEVRNLERRAADGADAQRDCYLIVETQRSAVLHRDLEDGKLTGIAGVSSAHRVVGVPDGPEVLDARLFQVGQIGRVMDDPHGIGLGEAGAQPVRERIVRRMECGLQGLAGHGPSATPPSAEGGRRLDASRFTRS